jgi:hypothetical protein
MNHYDSESRNRRFKKTIEQAKLLLPLEAMLEQLEDWEICVAEKRCPFHPDVTPSFSVFTHECQQFWKCHAGCGAGDQISYLELKFDLSRGEAVRLFLEMAGLAVQEGESHYE